MIKVQVLTIGTEITSGEILNSNAAWIATQLEEMGLRVFSHLSVRDNYDEILQALNQSSSYDLVIVSGGLGPTSDDITRECLADYSRRPLEFDGAAWSELEKVYLDRGLPLREAHRRQCHFPSGCERLRNPVGTAHGFKVSVDRRNYFVLPGPPRELQGMWEAEVWPQLKSHSPSGRWRRWTCLGAPESEVAELVEPVTRGSGLEVGYRAAVPYVKVKMFIDETVESQQAVALSVGRALAPYVVTEGWGDLASELLQLWPVPTMTLLDEVSNGIIAHRLFEAQANLRERQISCPALSVLSRQRAQGDSEVVMPAADLMLVQDDGEANDKAQIKIRLVGHEMEQSLSLPYKLKLNSERGRRSAAEWTFWLAVKQLKASRRQA